MEPADVLQVWVIILDSRRTFLLGYDGCFEETLMLTIGLRLPMDPLLHVLNVIRLKFWKTRKRRIWDTYISRLSL